MSPSLFPEYRCACGKLLFKGILLMSTVEVKCRYCRQLRLIRDMSADLVGRDALVFLFDSQGRIVNHSENAPEATGYSTQELAGMNAFMLNPVITPALYRKLWAQRISEPSSQASIFYRTKGGTTHEARAEFKFVDVRGAAYLFIVIDLSGTRTYAAAPPWIGSRPGEIYFELDPRGYCRPAVLRGIHLLGYADAQIVGKHIADLAPSLADGPDRRFAAHAKEHRPFEILQNSLRHADGRLVPAESYFIPAYEGGEFSGYWVCSWLTEPALIERPADAAVR